MTHEERLLQADLMALAGSRTETVRDAAAALLATAGTLLGFEFGPRLAHDLMAAVVCTAAGTRQ